jgi:hypothetical protein
MESKQSLSYAIAAFPAVPPDEQNADLGFGVTNPIYDEVLKAAQPPAGRRPV